MSPGRAAKQLVRIGPRTWLDLLRACAELAIARVRLRHASTERLLRAGASPTRAAAGQAELLDRVAFAIPRAAARVPWRSDCLVQALAARRWLERMGIASELKLGARKAAGQSLDAHAWLESGGRIVVGGESGDYRPFVRTGGTGRRTAPPPRRGRPAPKRPGRRR